MPDEKTPLAGAPAAAPDEKTPLAGTPAESGGPLASMDPESKRKFLTVASCGAFMICSAAMMLVNKQVVKTFDTPVTVLDLQLIFTAVSLSTLFFWALKFGSKRDVMRWVSTVPALYAGMLVTSMIAQKYAGVGLQVAIRNLGPLVALPIESVFNEPIHADFQTWAALVFILIGICMYVSESMKSQKMNELAAGIILMLLNMIIALFERLWQRKLIAIEPVDISKTGLLLLNNVGAIVPVSILLAIPLDGGWEYEHYPVEWKNASAMDYVLLLISGIAGMAIGYTAINAQQYVSATTMLVITNLNKVVVVIVGVLFMHEPHGPVAMVGISIALAGGVWYALARNNVADQAKKKKKEEEEKKKEDEAAKLSSP